MKHVLMNARSAMGGLAITVWILISVASCWKTPGDPFGIEKPEHLVTICHEVRDEGRPTGEFLTQMYSNHMAARHLDNHTGDYLGPCKVEE